jgi:VIT1/CCC1 family predicted Fe2+/Mn2+ transporter
MSNLLGYFVRYLDPADSLSEIIYGLIMVLSITLTAGYYVQDSSNPAKTLLIAAIGCNLAWGLIDGVMYVVTSMYERGTRNRLILAVRKSSDQEAAVTTIHDQIDTAVGALLSPEELKLISHGVYRMAQNAQPKEVRATRDDVMGGIACFLLNFVATLPASIPFLIIPYWSVALRVSNLVTIVIMFIVGYRWAKYANANRLRSGTGMALLGVCPVLIAVALGG